jgi:hypothetical protein
MKVWTSYYANIKNIPNDYFLVSTSRYVSEDILLNVDIQDLELSPTVEIFKEHKDNPNHQKFIKDFKSAVLENIDWLEKLETWETMATKNGKDISNIVLLCYEGAGDFCHRHILGESIENEFKTIVKEWGFEKMARTKDYKLVIENNMDILF